MNTTYCEWINSLIQANATAIFDQYQAWYTAKTGQYQTEMTAMETRNSRRILLHGLVRYRAN